MNEDEKAIVADLFSVVQTTLAILARHIDDKEMKKDSDVLATQRLILNDMEQSVEETLQR